MTTRTRCPGCGDWLRFNEDETDADSVIDVHTVAGCSKPDMTIANRLFPPPVKEKK